MMKGTQDDQPLNPEDDSEDRNKDKSPQNPDSGGVQPDAPKKTAWSANTPPPPPPPLATPPPFFHSPYPPPPYWMQGSRPPFRPVFPRPPGQRPWNQRTELKGKCVFGKEFKHIADRNTAAVDATSGGRKSPVRTAAIRSRQSGWKSRRPKTFRYVMFSLCVVVIIGAIAFWLYSHNPQLSEDLENHVEDAPVESSADYKWDPADTDEASEPFETATASPAQRVAWRYVESIGGLELWENTKTSVFSGYIESDRGEWDFQLIRRSPNLIKIDIYIDEYRISTAYDGTRAWREITHQGNVVNITEVDQEQEALMRATARFLNPLIEYFVHKREGRGEEERGHLQDLGMQDFDDRRLRVLSLDFSGTGETWNFYLDPASHELYASRHLQRGGHEVSTIYKDYFMSQGRRVPGSEAYYFDGTLINTMHVSRVRFNTGVLSGIFSRTLTENDAS